MKLRRRSFLAASSSVLALVGCQPFLTWVQQNGPTIDAAITQALSVMDDVDKWFTQVWFPAHPDAAKQEQERKIVDDVRHVAEGVAGLIAGGVALTQAQIVQAESDFASAWAAFVAFATSFGVKVGSASTTPHAMVASDGGLTVPEPVMLHLTKYVKGQ